MNDHQKAAYVFSQAVCAQIACAGMVAENTYRASRGETVAFVEEDFVALIEQYGIYHNAVLTVLHE